MVLPTNIASPQNLGIAFLCILLLSLGMSMAPTFGASFMDSGLTANDKINARKKVIHKVSYITSFLLKTFTPYIFSMVRPASSKMEAANSSGYPSLITILCIPALMIILAQIAHG